jgi:hypothetical protein
MWLKVFAFVAFQVLLGGMSVGLTVLVARGPRHLSRLAEYVTHHMPIT